MRSNNLRKMKVFYKKIAWLIMWVIVCTLLYMPRNQVSAEETPIPGNVNEIKILEIEPGNQFTLVGLNEPEKSTESTLIGDCKIQEINGKNIKITHVTMQQFISMVDDINGKYDVVVVGRKNTGLVSDYNKKYLDGQSGSPAVPYRDYSKPLSQPMDYLPLSTWESKSNWKPNYSTLDQIKFAEYYSENDITQKRANEIIKMIDSKQLVCMDNQIFNTTITKTNLYNLFVNKAYSTFGTASSDNNLIRDSLSNITIKNIVDKYNSMSQGFKRPQVTQVTKPTDDSNLTAAVRQNRNMRFNVTLANSQSDVLKANLYLDINADGLFKDVELVKTIDLQPGQTQYQLNYTLDSNFVGYLDWKIEIEKANGVKTNILGDSTYKSLIGAKTIKILQIRPIREGSDNTAYASIDLSKDTQIKKLVQDTTALNKDYNLIIESKTTKEVNDDANFKLNGNYDMVIIGFNDSYAFDELYPNVINELEAFIRTGQSVMFTHDTITPSITNNLSNTGPKALTQRFRDYVGQARYPDAYRLKSGIIDEKDIYKKYTKDSNGNLQLTEKTIPHDSFYYNSNDDKSGNSNKAYSLGTTLQGHVNGVQYNWSSWNYITGVKKVNSAQINQYPFILSNEIEVARTHTQWYQLNLEDPDVVPWYNMSSSTFDTGDARNYYYTYSKGNITFSGAGHNVQKLSDGTYGFPLDESKLFINTMIKAERGANHAPIIKCSIPNETTDPANETINNVIVGGKHTFTVDADDFEHEIVNMHVTIDGQKLSSSDIQVTLTKRGGTDSATMDDDVFPIDPKNLDRKEIQITIPDSKLQNAGDKTTIKIDATDPQLARREKTYILQAINAPNFTVNTNLSDLDTVDVNDQYKTNPPKSDNPIKVEKTDRIKAGYKIEPQALQYGEAIPNRMTKEVAVLIDSSKDNSGNRFNQSKNAVMDNILNYYLSTNDDVRMDIMSYNDTVKEKYPYIDSRNKDINGVPIDYRNELQNQLNSITSSSSTQRSLGKAVGRAVEFFKNNNQVQSGKTIIVISAGDPTDDIDPFVLQTIKDNNYNIITIALEDSLGNRNKYPKLLQWHNQMGGLPGDYYISKDENDIMNVISYQIHNSIGSFKYPTYILKNVKLKFNLGEDIDLDKGLIDNPDSDDPKEYIQNLPDIKYMAREEGNPKKLVYYGYFEDSVSATSNSSYPVNFIIKPNQQSNVTTRVFIGDNSLNYLDVVNANIKNQLYTPILNLDETKVEHGVYRGILSGKADLEPGTLGFAKDSVVPFAANISGLNSSTNLRITIDPNTQISEKPKIYKIDGEKLKLIGTLSDTDNPIVFQLNNFDSTLNNNIIVLYSVKLGEIPPGNPQQYTNTVFANGIPAPVTIAQSDNKLRDLF